MNYDNINELLNAPEGEHYQFKEAKNRFDFGEAVKCCCALSNCGGGKLVLGISDKRPRKVVGSTAFDQPERTREGLINKLRVKVDFQLLEHEGKRILVFDVAARPRGLVIQVDGIAWWYDGDSHIAMPDNIRRDIYAEIGHDFSGDICVGATLQDLDAQAIEAFRTIWAAKSGNNRILNVSVEQLLTDCEAMKDGELTFAALILFGTRAALGKYLPQSEIVFEYRMNEASGPAQQRVEFRVGFFACYDRIWELINLRNNKQHYQEGLFLFDILTFNERIVREALLNAVSHRNYQLSGSVFVRQYNDRLVMENPGGLPKGITLENMLYKQSPRNRRIAEIFALCGLVERSGQGMNLMYELCIMEAKSLPDFNGTDEFFVCITLNGLILDKKMLSLINRIGSEHLAIFSTDDFLVINALFYEQKLSDHLKPRIKRLIGMGIVEHAGRGKYVLARKLYEATGKSGVHTRLKGLDKETNKALLFKHIQKNNGKGTPLKELQQVLPSHSRSQIQALLRELRDEKKIYSAGKTNGSKWFLLSD
ncbi:MAG: putative DNA binding domain-containing protein [Firmicutes bacterium]|nr:putative DNA binding domain-containing protein [Bacillota bacterium]